MPIFQIYFAIEDFLIYIRANTYIKAQNLVYKRFQKFPTQILKIPENLIHPNKVITI